VISAVNRGQVHDKAVVVRPSGDSALVVEFEQCIDLAVAARVHALMTWLEEHRPTGMIEAIPGYCTVFVHYDAVQTQFTHLQQLLLKAVADGGAESLPPMRQTIEIPVCYGGEFGPDLPEVAKMNDLGMEDVIRYHTNTDYYVYFTGFLPSFPFLGGMPQVIATRRLSQPRTKVPAGSVGIAGEQTGVYPVASPGGWRIIGRTPVSLFDMGREHPFLLQAGDWVRFVPISENEFWTV
jgi:inhibitor of KinA